jgi:hypothetical protein
LKEFDAANVRVEGYSIPRVVDSTAKNGAKSKTGPAPQVVAEDGPKPTVTKQTVKPKRIVKPSEILGNVYLENASDVDNFLEKLRQTLSSAIANNERIEIR